MYSTDLVAIQNNWYYMPDFQAYVGTFRIITSPLYTMQDIVSKFMSLAINKYE